MLVVPRPARAAAQALHPPHSQLVAAGRAAIDRMVERILPAMRERGGYIPTCDHGVPMEVSLADYRYYRERCFELGG